MVEVIVQTPGGIELADHRAAPAPRARDEADENIRLTQMAKVLDLTRPWREAESPASVGRRFLIPTSPVQIIDRAQVQNGDAGIVRSQRREHSAREVVSRFLENGYVDSLHACDPTAAATQATFTHARARPSRVDYLFTFGIDRAKIRRAWIEHDRLATFASDHYPIGVEIDV